MRYFTVNTTYTLPGTDMRCEVTVSHTRDRPQSLSWSFDVSSLQRYGNETHAFHDSAFLAEENTISIDYVRNCLLDAFDVRKEEQALENIIGEAAEVIYGHLYNALDAQVSANISNVNANSFTLSSVERRV